MYGEGIIGYLFDGYGFHVEDHFKYILHMEKKRTERSGLPFLLMLVNIESIVKLDEHVNVISDLASVLLTVTRETDIKGWYNHGSTIGVIFAGIPRQEITAVANNIYRKIYCALHSALREEHFNRIRFSSQIFPEDSTENSTIPDLEGYPDVSRKNSPKSFSAFLKRFMDITGGFFFLVLFSSAMVVIALLIKLSSKGPVLFRQKRIGLSGKPFTILKFRSMYDNSNQSIHKEHIESIIKRDPSLDGRSAEKSKAYKIQQDPRITPIGKLIRFTHFDELPQLINVLKGEMSLVGPRPPLPYEFVASDLWHRRRVFEAKPGMTGLWQVRRRRDTSYDEMVRWDLQYAKAWSLWLDIQILFCTPWAIITSRAKGNT
jgi:lipopolysaccharide/colanic/teichoic acid biosynthesis glycosyltransferase